jgi:hypothetical protein
MALRGLTGQVTGVLELGCEGEEMIKTIGVDRHQSGNLPEEFSKFPCIEGGAR